VYVGAVAQLGERHVCNVDVAGSIPVGSIVTRPRGLAARKAADIGAADRNSFRPLVHPVHMVLRAARLLTVLLTTLAASAAGALNGRVLCIGDGGHVAVEAPHTAAACPATTAARHACYGGRADDANVRTIDADARADATLAAGGDAHQGESDDCTDVEADGTPVRETPAATLAGAHLPQPFASVPPALWSDRFLSARLARPTTSALGHPPACGDLARLRAIVLLV
jgi:hypothetical protein